MRRPSELGEAIIRRAAAFSRFERWERAHPVVLQPGRAVAAVGAVYELLPPASRSRGVSVEGVAALHRALAMLSTDV